MSVGKRACGVLLLATLVLLGIVRSHLGTRLDSMTVDEPWHIVAGTSYVRSGDFRLNPEHPPLAKLWVGAWMPDDFRLQPLVPLSEKMQERDQVEETLFFDNDSSRAQHHARLAMWSLNGSLIFVLGLLLWRAFDLAWAAGSLAFLAIEPTVAAHLPVVMTDLPLALSLIIAAVCAGLLAAEWRWRWVLGFGVAVGLSLGAKHSALAGIAGIVAVLVVAALSAWRGESWRGVSSRLGKLALAGLIGVAVLWAQYGFHFHPGPDGSDHFNRGMADKIADLNVSHYRESIAFADRWQLLPRAYLWGLADTVRTGVEGRGISEHFVWGRTYEGRAPWFTWPAILASKVPLALLALSLVGVALSWRASLPAASRWALWTVIGASSLHLLALLGSQGIWGGVRHAMPLLVALSVPAGAAVAQARARRSRAWMAAVALLFAAAIAMTIREPRAWEYHNELVGGSRDAYRYFGNEGLDLGQRFAEIRAFHDRVIKPGGQPMYSDYWMGEEQMRAAGLNYHRRVESLQDTNVEGIYEGYFVYGMSSTLPWPSWDWDPQEVFKELRLVARFGNVGIWHGRQVRPQTRAGSLYGKVEEYIYKENGDDWPLVAKRLEEVVARLPQSVAPAVELGNAYVRMGNGPAAIKAYRRLLDQEKVPVDPLVRQQLEAQIAQIESNADLSGLKPVRNPWLE